MNWSGDDTIVAVAAPPGVGARAILRLSGPQTLACVNACFTPDEPGTRWPAAAVRPSARPGRWRAASSDVTLPGDLYFWPDQRGFTRQPTVEFHTLPSPPLLDALLLDLQSLGVRLARPGEFTYRAFLSGRLDLTQAEAVLAVIDSQDQQQLQTALKQLAGGLARPLSDLRDRLLDLTAQIEARLDFTEEDVPPLAASAVIAELQASLGVIAGLLERCSDRILPGTRPHVVLVGPPNAGKSSLFNALLGRDAALVSPQEGTTRDRLSSELDCGGLVVELHDTAGWTNQRSDALDPADDEASASPSESIAQAMQRQTQAAVQQADLLLICQDAASGTEPATDPVWSQSPAQRLFIRTKCDLAAIPPDHADVGPAAHYATSALTGAGLPALVQAIAQVLRQDAGEVCGPTAVRCRGGLQQAYAACQRGQALAERGGAEELVAHELREALTALADVSGATSTDDVLDRIFSRFCIGK